MEVKFKISYIVQVHRDREVAQLIVVVVAVCVIVLIGGTIDVASMMPDALSVT